MDQEPLTPELEKLLKQVRLREPSQELMADYLAGVNAKIERGINTPHFGFPQVTLVLVIGLAFVGIFYFMFMRSLNRNEAPALQTVNGFVSHSEERSDASRSSGGRPLSHLAPSGRLVEESQTETLRFAQGDSVPKTSQGVSVPVPEVALSLEEELALLEAFEEELSGQESDWLEDEELLEELALLDELEISTMSVQTVAQV